MNDKMKAMNNDEIRDFCIKKDLKIFELEQENEKLNNIIKEVREYLNNHIEQWNNVEEFINVVEEDEYILSLLDKEK